MYKVVKDISILPGGSALFCILGRRVSACRFVSNLWQMAVPSVLTSPSGLFITFSSTLTVISESSMTADSVVLQSDLSIVI